MYTAHVALASKPSLLNLLFSRCCKLGSLGANSKTELVCMNVIKECLGISTCGREGKERERRRSGHRKKSSCDTVAVIALDDATGISGAGMALQSCARLGQNG